MVVSWRTPGNKYPKGRSTTTINRQQDVTYCFPVRGLCKERQAISSSHLLLELGPNPSATGQDVGEVKSAAVEAHRRLKREEHARVICIEV